jgi:hypothetical protein
MYGHPTLKAEADASIKDFLSSLELKTCDD